MKNYFPKKIMILGVKQLTLVTGLFLFLGRLHASGQAPDFEWARHSQGNNITSNAVGRGIAHDILGNSYVTGYFEGSVTFGGNTPTSTTLTSSGSDDVFVAKYDADGNLLWAKKAGGPNSDAGTSIAVHANGNCYITGYFHGSAIFGSITLKSSEATVFLAKYDAAGNVLWAKLASGKGSKTSEARSIAVDGSGNSYITGYFWGRATFGSTTLTSSVDHKLASSGQDVFVAKYDANGNVLWAKQSGGINYNSKVANSITVDGNGNSYITGYFGGGTGGSITFGSTTLTGSGNGNGDVFVVKYGASGNVLWAKKAGGASNDEARSIAVDGSGNSYVTGYFSGSATFDNTTLTSLGNSDIFVAKYDAAGNVLWVKQAGGTNNAWGTSIAVDGSGNSYVNGAFHGSATFGSTTLTSSGSSDIFVAKYSASGNVLWAKKAGGASNDEARSIAVDGSGNSYITGYFNGNATFGSTTLTSSGSPHFFIAKINTDNSSTRYALTNAGSGSDGNVLQVYNVNAYPNPFTDKLTMELSTDAAAEIAKVTLTTIDGKTVYQKEVKLNNGRVSEEMDGLSRLPAGLYFLRLQLNDKPIVLKVMKQ